MSTRQVENACGVSQSFLSQIEQGKKNPSPHTLKKLAPVYRISYEEIMALAGYLDNANNDLSTSDKIKIALRSDPDLTEEQKRMLSEDMADYFAFKKEQYRRDDIE